MEENNKWLNYTKLLRENKNTENEEANLNQEELERIKLNFLHQGYAGRIYYAMQAFKKVAPDLKEIPDKMKELDEIVNNETRTVQEINYLAYEKWRETRQKHINIDEARRYKIKRRKECRDDTRKTFLRISKPQGSYCDVPPSELEGYSGNNWETKATYNEDDETIFITEVQENNFKISAEKARNYLEE
jgi:hypothetical protein